MIVLGQRINNFEVVRLLGEGGMGSVYEAKHPLIDKRVAIKVLKPELSVDAELVQRFFNEARATSAIRHANIVDVIDLGTLPGGTPYLVMELLEGEGLGDRLDRIGRLEIPAAVDFARQAASALEAAHTRGVVHRDLKPDNLFLVPDPRLPGRELVKVLDFGIAKLRGELPASPVNTMAGAVLGTPPYMSPEQCRGIPQQLDHRTDIYALGIILYEMLCGHTPFEGEGLGEVMMLHMTVPPPPPSQQRPEVPPHLEQVILRALAKKPDERFASMGELRAALGPSATPIVVLADAARNESGRVSTIAFAAGGGAGSGGSMAVPLERVRPASGKSERASADSAERAVARGEAELDPEHSGEQSRSFEEAATLRTAAALPPVSSGPTALDEADTDPGLEARAAARRRRMLTSLGVATAIAAVAWLFLPRAEPEIPAASAPSLEPSPPAPIGAVAPPAPAPAAPIALPPATTPPEPAAVPNAERGPAAAAAAQTHAHSAPGAHVPRGSRHEAPSERGSRAAHDSVPEQDTPAPEPAAVASAQAQASPSSGAAPALRGGASSETKLPPGFLSLDSSPWANVYLGAKLLGTTPLMHVPLPPGRQVLTLQNPELDAQTTYVIEIKSGDSISRLVGWEKK